MGRKKRESSVMTKKFADNLSELISNSGKRQGEICAEIGISKSIMSEWLSDLKTPTAEMLCALAEYFHTSVDYLLGRSEVPSVNLTIQKINAEIGLSDQAISNLMVSHDLGEKEIADFLSILVTSSEIQTLISAVEKKNKFAKQPETGLIGLGSEALDVDAETAYRLYAETLLWRIIGEYVPQKEGD